MEWTKENTVNTHIVCRSSKAYKKAMEFYKEIGFVPMNGIVDIISKRKNTMYIMYVRSKFIDITSTEHAYIGKEIKPFYKPRRKFPRAMLVSNDNKKWERRVVIGKVKSNSPYVAQMNGKDFEEGQIFKFLLAFKYAKEEITK